MRRPISFVATQAPEAAKQFYREVMGLDLVEASPFALVFSDGDSMLRVQIVAQLRIASHTVHGWQVDDIEHEIKGLSAKGVVFLTFGQLEQDASGVWCTPNGDKIAWFKDPCGNMLSLTEFAAQ